MGQRSFVVTVRFDRGFAADLISRRIVGGLRLSGMNPRPTSQALPSAFSYQLSAKDKTSARISDAIARRGLTETEKM
jgi:hypothetical protein